MTQISEQTSTQALVEQLFKLYNKVVFSKENLAKLMDVSISYISKSLAKGYGIPNYKRLGNKKNSKVIFNINDVAEFLADTTQTL